MFGVKLIFGCFMLFLLVGKSGGQINVDFKGYAAFGFPAEEAVLSSHPVLGRYFSVFDCVIFVSENR